MEDWPNRHGYILPYDMAFTGAWQIKYVFTDACKLQRLQGRHELEQS